VAEVGGVRPGRGVASRWRKRGASGEYSLPGFLGEKEIGPFTHNLWWTRSGKKRRGKEGKTREKMRAFRNSQKGKCGKVV